MERQNKEVVVFEAEQYNAKWPPEGAAAFREWLEDQLADIPPEHMESAKVVIDSEASYEDGALASIRISYTRPETDDEIAEREASRRRRLAEEKDRLRRELERLERDEIWRHVP